MQSLVLFTSVSPRPVKPSRENAWMECLLEQERQGASAEPPRAHEMARGVHKQQDPHVLERQGCPTDRDQRTASVG